MMRMRYVIILSVILIFTVFCGQDNNSDRMKKDKKNEKTIKKKQKNDDAVPVQIIKAKRGNISSYLLFSSNIDTEKAADIYPMTTGIVEQIHYDVGDEVKKGIILAELDSREASLNEKKSGINFKQLSMDFERKKELYKKQLISKETYEKAKFDMKQAELDWEQKKLLLSYTKIISPISGIVSKREIKVGNKISTSQLAFSVVFTKEKIAKVNIPEQEKNQIFKNQRVIITANKISLEGRIKNISPSIDPESGTFTVRVIVEDKKGQLSIGQFVNLKIVKKMHSNVILLTKDALIYEGGRVFVFKVGDKNLSKKQLVKIGFDNGVRVEIIKGVSLSDKIITAGKSSLKDKTKVKIIESIL